MADICMCKGDGCSIRANCYRFTATPNEYRQSYFSIVPVDEDGVTCKDFWANRSLTAKRDALDPDGF